MYNPTTEGCLSANIKGSLFCPSRKIMKSSMQDRKTEGFFKGSLKNLDLAVLKYWLEKLENKRK